MDNKISNEHINKLIARFLGWGLSPFSVDVDVDFKKRFDLSKRMLWLSDFRFSYDFLWLSYLMDVIEEQYGVEFVIKKNTTEVIKNKKIEILSITGEDRLRNTYQACGQIIEFYNKQNGLENSNTDSFSREFGIDTRYVCTNADGVIYGNEITMGVFNVFNSDRTNEHGYPCTNSPFELLKLPDAKRFFVCTVHGGFREIPNGDHQEIKWYGKIKPRLEVDIRAMIRDSKLTMSKRDWSNVSKYFKLNIDEVLTYQTTLDFVSLWKSGFYDYDSYIHVISNAFTGNVQKNVLNKGLSSFELKDEDIEKFNTLINWGTFLLYQPLTIEKINKYKDKIRWEYVASNTTLSTNVILEFIDELTPYFK